MKKFLVPVDGSPGSIKAIDKAIVFGAPSAAQITLITVVPEALLLDTHTNSKGYTESMVHENISEGQKILTSALTKLHGYPGPVKSVLRIGNVVGEIVNYAAANGYDLIIMGNRGLGSFSRTLLGSISHKVLNMGTVSVLIVK